MTDKRLGHTRAMLASPSTDGELVFTASAEGTNRYGFSLNKRRWKTDNFNNNPVILWMHNDFMPPIGRGRASIDTLGLRTGVTFDRSDPFAVTIENKYRSGFLNAVSVGFDFVDEKGVPIQQWWAMSPDEISTVAFYDLAEVSAVPVPADPNALIRQRYALAFDFGLYVPETEDAMRELLAGRPERQNQITAPTLPGNSDVERRLGAVEKILTHLTGIPSHNTDVVDTEWDGSVAVEAMPNDSNVLRYCHAWRDAGGGPDAKSTYKFPHHLSQDGPANLNGVRNALAQLENSGIPDSEKAGVEQHLRNHLGAGDTDNDFAPDVVANLMNLIKL